MTHGRVAAGSVALVGFRRRSRAALLRGTALQAAAWAVLAAPAAAQLAPTARPSGGQVAAGQATIGGNATTTLVTQRSQGAIINWQSYNVGSAQTVRYAQPNSSALALNRVLGPNPSEIAGRIDANGQIIIVNQSGVVFDRGSQVNTAGLVASTVGMTNKNFLAGRMVLDQAGRPGARVINAGNITVRQAGLAALVAPQVANSGTITAQLGHVLLAGGEAATLDLYGDRLVSLNVTRAVHTVSLGGQAVPALVTNSGTLLAPGGTVVLTARDADAVVTNLVQAGGTIAADTLGSRRGSVLVAGVGGSVQIDGTVSASGTAVGQRGGTIAIAATNAVTVGGAAQVTASGYAGGGQILLGTARHHGGRRGTALGVSIAQGAAVRADATGNGNGGRISVLSQDTINQGGALSARGAGSGSGGDIALSGSGVLTISGLEDAGAAAGQAGHIQVSSNLVEITNNKPDPGYTAINTQTIDAMTGDVTVSAGHTLKLLSDVQLSSYATGFDLQAGTLLVLSANWNAGSLSGVFSSGSGGIVQTAGVVTAGSLDLESTGAVTQSGGSLNLGTLLGHVGGASLTGTNSVYALGALTTTGNFTLDTASALSVAGPLQAGRSNVSLSATDLAITGAVTTTGAVNLFASAGNIVESGAGAIDAGSLSGAAAAGRKLAGSVTLNGANSITLLGSFTAAGDFALTNAAPLRVTGPLDSSGANITLDVTGTGNGLTIAGDMTAAQAISLTAASMTQTAGTLAAASIALTSAGTVTQTGGMLNTGVLTANVGGASLTQGNVVATLGAVTTTGDFAFTDAGSLTVGGALAGGSHNVTLTGASVTIADVISTTGTVDLIATGGDISEIRAGVIDAGALAGSAAAGGGLPGSALLGANNAIGALAAFSTAGDFELTDQSALTVRNAVASSGGNVTLDVTAGQSLTIDAGVSAAKLLSLTAGGSMQIAGTLSGTQIGLLAGTVGTAGGDITETGAGAIDAASGTGTLSADAVGSVVLAGAANHIGAVSLLLAQTGDVTLSDVDSLTVAGTVSAANGAIALAAGNSGAPAAELTIDSSISGTAVILSATGTVSEAASVMVDATAGALSVQAGSGISFAGTLVSGTLVTAGNTVTGLAGGGGVSLATSRGDITEAVTGTLGAATLAASAGGALVLAPGGAAQNWIVSIGDVNAGGGASIADLTAPCLCGNGTVGGELLVTVAPGGGPMVLAGTMSAGSADIVDAAGIVQTAGALTTTTGTLALDAASGGIAQAAGATLDAATLLSLTAGASSDFSAISRLGVVYGIDLAGSAGGGGVALTASAGSIIENAATGTLKTAGTLTAVADASNGLYGDIDLSSASNSIAVLGTSHADAALLLRDAAALTVNGTVYGGQGVGITDTGAANGITITGTLQTGTPTLVTSGSASWSVYSGAIVLAADGSITEDQGGAATGVIRTGTLAAASGGAVQLDNASNAIGTLGAVALVAATDAGTLTGSGVTAGTTVRIFDTTFQGASTAAGPALVVATQVTSTGGDAVYLAAPSLTILGAATSTGGSILLQANRFDLAGPVSTGTAGLVAFDLLTPGALTLTGLASDSFAGAGLATVRTARLDLGSLADPAFLMGAAPGDGHVQSITIGGPLDLTGIAGTLGLFAQGAIDAPAPVTVGALFGAAGSATFDSATNAVGTLGSFLTSNGLIVADAVSLLVADGAQLAGGAGGIAIDVTDPTQSSSPLLTLGTASGATLTAAGAIALAADGGIAQNGGLVESTGGAVSLAATRGGVTQSGGNIVSDKQDVAVAAAGEILQLNGGTLSAATTAVLAAGGGIGFAGLLSAGDAMLLSAAGGISENPGGGATGRIDTATLAARAGGSIDLSGTDNAFGAVAPLQSAASGLALAGLTAGGAIYVNDTQSLTLADAAVSAATGIDIHLLDTAGAATGTLTQTGGSISVTAGTTGTVTLQALAVAQNGGTVTAPGNIDVASDSLTQTGGTITSGGGSVAIAGALTQDGASQVSAAQTASVGGTLTQTASSLTGTQGVSVTGAAAQNSGTITAAAGAVQLGSTLDQTAASQITGLTVSAGGDVTQSASSISGTNGVAVTGGVAQTGGTITSGGGSVSITGALTQDGASQVSAAQTASVGGTLTQTASSLTGTQGVSVTGAATQNSGTITAAAGAVQLGSTLAQTAASLITGLTVSAGGDVTQSTSSISGTNGVAVTGGVAQTDGTIAAANGSVTVIGAAVTQAGESSITGGTGVALALSGDMQQAAGSTIAAASGALVIDSSGGAIEIGGTLRSAGKMLLYAGGGDIAETAGGGTNGQIVAGTLAAGATGAIMLNVTGTLQNQIGEVAALSAPVPSETNVRTLSLQGLTAGSNVELGDGIGLVIADASLVQAVAGNIGIDVQGNNAPGLTIGTAAGATLAAGQSVSLQADGAIAQTGGSIGAVLGSASILAGGGVTQTGASISAGTSLLLQTGGSLVQAGSVMTAGGSIGVQASGGVQQSGSTIVAGANAAIAAGGSIGQAASAIRAGGNADIAAGGNVSQSQGSVMQGTGGLTVQAVHGLTSQASTLVAAAGTVTVSAQDGIAFDGLIESGGATGANGVFVPSGPSSVTLYSAGDITESAGGGATGRILAGTLVATAGGSLNLADTGTSAATGNQVAVIGGLVADGGDAAFTDQANLTIQGGAVVSAAGSIGVAIGNASGGTPFGLALDRGAAMRAGGGVTLSAATLSQAAGSTIAAGGPIVITTSGTATLAGTLSTPGAVSLSAASIDAATAAVDAGVLAARAGGAIDIGNTGNRIGTIGVAGTLSGLAAGGAITIGDAASLAIDANVQSGSGAVEINGRQDVSEAQGVSMQAATALQILAPDSIFIAGALTAPRIVLGDTATQSVTWAGSTIRTGSSLPARINAQTLTAPLAGNQPGVFVTAANFSESGTATVLPLGGPQATMQLTITGTGAATFQNLYAPNTQLLLSLLRGGYAKGKIDVAGLNVFYMQGLKPRIPTQLTGRVGKYTGTAAAGAGFSHNQPNINYQMNGCPIQSLNCVLLSPVVVPVVDPVQDYFVGTTRHRHDDDDALPNVGEADY